MHIFTAAGFVLMLLVVAACGDTQSASTNPPSIIVSTEVTGNSNQTAQVGLTPSSNTGAGSSDQAPGTVSPSPSQSAQPGAANQRLFDRVFIIVLENADYAQAIAQPYL